MKKKLRILALLCALAVLMGVSVLAESTPIDTGDGWSYTLEDGHVVMTANEGQSNLYLLITPWERYSSVGDVTSVEMGPGFGRINGGFNNCTSLQTVVISNTATEITINSFTGCTALTEVTIPVSVKKFGTDIVSREYMRDVFSSADKDLLTIRGYENTWAQIFAEEFGYTFVSLGAMPQQDLLITQDEAKQGTDGVLFYPAEEKIDAKELVSQIPDCTRVIFDDGIYTLDGELKITRKVGITICAKNPGKTELLSTDGSAPVIGFYYSLDVAVKDLLLGHSYVSTTSDSGCSGVGLSGANVIQLTYCENVTVDNCDLWGCGMIAVYMLNSRNVEVRDSVLRDCIVCGVFAQGSKNALFENCIISGNKKSNCPANANYPCIRLAGSENEALAFTGCTFLNNQNDWLLPEDETLAAAVTMTDCVFSNNLWDGEEKITGGVCYNTGITWEIEEAEQYGYYNLYLGRGLTLDDGTTLKSGTGEVPVYSEYSIPWKEWDRAYNYHEKLNIDFSDGVKIPWHYQHTWGEPEKTREANCGDWGLETYTCTECGVTKQRSADEPTGLHVWDEGVKQEGYTLYTCTVCGETMQDDITGSCGMQGDNLQWLLHDGTLTISGEGEMMDNASWKVWEIYANQINKVVVEEGVTTLGFVAFQNFRSLTEVELPDSLTRIGAYAFDGCSSLTEITIPDGVTIIDAACFAACSSLTSVTIPDGVTVIGERAFHSCTGLTDVTIPDGVTIIDVSCFDACSSLTSVTIPESVTFISLMAFDRCESLTDVYFLGSEEQWNAVEYSDCNDPLFNATIHFGAAVKVGDTNGDGNLDSKDAIYLARAIAKWDGYTVDLAAGDLNGDGQVNSKDNIILARHIAKWTGYDVLPLP